MLDSQAAVRLALAKQAIGRHLAETYGFDYDAEVANMPASGQYHDLFLLEAWARAIENAKPKPKNS
jgi:hypothetical protein